MPYTGRTRNSGRTCPAEKSSPLAVISHVERLKSLLKKNSAFPSRCQRGQMPPYDDTCHLPAPWRKGTTERLVPPVSSVEYATHFPSGEIAGVNVLPGPWTTGKGFPSVSVRSSA